MKVAIIAPTPIPSIKANTIQVVKMTQAISSIGHQVQLVIPDYPDSNKNDDRKWETFADHYGLQSRFPMTWLPAKTGWRKYDYAWKAVSWASEWGADVIFTRLPQAAALAANRNLSTIFEVHDKPQGTIGPILLRLFLRGKGAQKLVLISRSLAEDLAQDSYFPPNSERIEVLPDGVDLHRYEGLPGPAESRTMLLAELAALDIYNSATFSPDAFTVGYTGHLYPGRGVSLMIDIAAQLPETNFLIVGGEPNDVRELRKEVKERALGNITLTGFVPNSKLPAYQAACDVLLMPYRSRVSASSGGDIGRYLSPMKLFEYLASGRAICSSDLPVLQEILTPDIAVLLPTNGVEAWVAAIQRLIENPDLRKEFSKSARTSAQKYSWDARAEKILAPSNITK